MNKILVYSPYWDTKGGGERYVLTVANCLKDSATVLVGSITASNLKTLGEQLGISVDGLTPVLTMPTPRQRLAYDGIFWLSDGSIPFLPVKKRVIHFQAPFANIEGRSIPNRLKLLGADVVCNSQFTKKFIDAEFGISSRVIYPPVATQKFTPMKKDNLILSVGRFATSSQHKRPDFLIQMFKNLVDNGLKNWRLCIVGISENEESHAMVATLRKMAKGYPIAIQVNLPHYRLTSLFNHASIYWHAAGFDSNLETYPQRAEHFGISTVEAMAAGAVPCVFAAGGQLEIVSNGQNGLFWESPRELISQTLELIKDSTKRNELSLAALRRARDFGEDRFCEEIKKLFNC